MRIATLESQRWTNYEFQPAFVLGFHGCDAAVGEAILHGATQHLKSSENDYDWLGNGIYFWEGNPTRALQFAVERAQGGRNSQGDIREPFVLGAVINLKRCLNLADSGAIAQAQSAYDGLQKFAAQGASPLPANSVSLKARRLDCLVFNWLHKSRQSEGLPPYDTVRGLFWEGAEIYPGAGLREANHIQICVRHTDCILGYFRPISV